MWRILVLLRTGPQTIPQLARMLSVSERTIRRDLYALQRVPLPITSLFDTAEGRRGVRTCDPNVWSIAEMPAWPGAQLVPVDEPSIVAARL